MRRLSLIHISLGFEHVGPLPVQALECLPEVREMCAADRCHAYGRRWTCPPGCGTLEDCARRLAGYRSGLLVQSTGRLEDDFDAETMLETERIHKERFAALAAEARRSAPDCLPLGAGTCTLCPECTYPDRPCRFYKFTLIDTDNKRSIVLIDKVKPTPKQFPRKAGKPLKEPIK